MSDFSRTMSDREHNYGAMQQRDADINVGEVERWASALGGGALALYGLSKAPSGLLLTLLGGVLVYRGVTGHCHVYEAMNINTAEGQAHQGFDVEKTVTINRPVAEVYSFWRDFSNLPRFMKHLESVTVQGDRRSHWVATGPAGVNVEWDAEITDEQPNELIAWRSTEGADVSNAGTVRFSEAPGNRGTEVHVSMNYSPPAGVLGAAVAKLFGEEPNQQVEGDLRRLRSVLEAGEVPTTAGQPEGKRSIIGSALRPEQKKPETEPTTQQTAKEAVTPRKRDLVSKASEDSFPASDPPAFAGTARASTETAKEAVTPRKRDLVSKASEDSFPASDPPAFTGTAAKDFEREAST